MDEITFEEIDEIVDRLRELYGDLFYEYLVTGDGLADLYEKYNSPTIKKRYSTESRLDLINSQFHRLYRVWEERMLARQKAIAELTELVDADGNRVMRMRDGAIEVKEGTGWERL